MARLVGEAHDLVLDRRAIARPGAFDLAGIQRCAVDIGGDDVMGRRAGIGDVAGDLRRRNPVGQGRERHRRIVAGLDFERRPVDGFAVEPRRRAGLEPPERETAGAEGFRQTAGRRLADPPGRNLLLADMDKPVEKRTGGQHDAGRADDRPVREHHPGDMAAAAARCFDHQILHPAGADSEIRLVREHVLHGAAVELAVGLGARPLHGRPLAAVENAELDAGAVDHPAHDAVEGIDLAHEMPLAEPADRRVARHLADGVGLVGDQQGAGAEPGRRRGSLAARMAAAHDDHVTGRSRRGIRCWL